MRRIIFIVLLVLFALPAHAGKEFHKTLRIASGTTTTPIFDLHDMCLVGWQWPAVFTGTTVTAECSTDKTIFGPTKDSSGVAWILTFEAGTFVDLTLDGMWICGCRWVQFVSDATELGDRDIGVQAAGD